jgi:amidase
MLNMQQSPSGSSSGSAIATSAGLCPVSLGTETFGSLVNPANRASLYTLKPTLGIVPGEGILPISKHFDTAGPIAKTVVDVANLLTVLVDSHKTEVPAGGYSSALGGAWGDIKVGTLDPAVWKSPPHVIKPMKGIDDEIVRLPHTCTVD